MTAVTSAPIDRRSASSATARLAQVGRLVATVARRPAEIRFAARYVSSRGHDPLQLRLPWLPYSVIEALTPRAVGARVFEYGGGGSTLWIGARAAQVTTVEHDQQWYGALTRATTDLANVTILLRTLEARDGMSYVSTIGEDDDRCFDIVIVDGRRRMECVRRAMSKVTPGGLLVLDDSDRPKYGAARTILAGWSAREYFGLVPCKDRPGTTTIFTRPAAAPR
jgi:hypothetical protein